MPLQSRSAKAVWPERLAQIDSKVDAIRMPDSHRGDITQDAEWCEVVVDGREHRIRFHDYDEIYKIPGLYEEIFYKNLKCCSPSRVAALLGDVIRDFQQDPSELRVLDVGAGNGMVGDELDARSVPTIVGIDILPEAKEAAQRDRPGVYDDYLATDLTNLPEQQEKRLRDFQFNCLTTVAALGFGDIPPDAFSKALDLIEVPGWAAFTIKEEFLHEEDRSGFAGLIRELSRQRIIQIQAYRRFRHRQSITGKPLYYVAMVARKLANLPDALLAG
jgi:hypothetical protein